MMSPVPSPSSTPPPSMPPSGTSTPTVGVDPRGLEMNAVVDALRALTEGQKKVLEALEKKGNGKKKM